MSLVIVNKALIKIQNSGCRKKRQSVCKYLLKAGGSIIQIKLREKVAKHADAGLNHVSIIEST